MRMSMTEVELRHQVESLSRLVGRSLRHAWQPSRDRVLLGFDDGTVLLIVPRGQFARAHTCLGRPKNPQRPFSFQGALRARLGSIVASIVQINSDRVLRLHFRDWSLEIRLTGGRGGIWMLDDQGRPTTAYDGPCPASLPELPERELRAEVPRYTPEGGEDWDLAARHYFTGLEREAERSRLATEVQRRLGAERARLRRLLHNLNSDLDKASNAPSIRRLADALAASLHTVGRGLDQVAVPDPYEPENTLFVPLDPAHPPAHSLKRLYQKARRLERMGDLVIDRIDETENAIRRLSALDLQISELSLVALRELDATLPQQRRGTPRATTAAQPWATWTSPNGLKVLVGRSAKGNRLLTFQRARGADVWLHLRDRPGAHLIIPCQAGHPPPLELLLTAAEICLATAGTPQGEAADVQYTFARNVKGIPGAADGLVLVHDEKVLHVRRDPSLVAGWTRDPP